LSSDKLRYGGNVWRKWIMGKDKKEVKIWRNKMGLDHLRPYFKSSPWKFGLFGVV
jgi:hypothetical protein